MSAGNGNRSNEMDCIVDQNYYDGRYMTTMTSGQDEARRSRARAAKNFNAKELFLESNSQTGGEQRPTKFPVKNELDVILRKVRSVLNKISSLNYNKLQIRWLNLIPTEPDQLTEVFQLLVTKALDDPMYMKIYARLIRDVLVENPSNASFLRASLCNQLHHALQNTTTDMELAKFGRSHERGDAARRRRVMLYRFTAELYMENVCSTKFVTERITDLIGQGKRLPQDADEPLECICVMLMFAGSKLEEYKGSWLNDVFVNLNLTETSKLPIVSKRMQFMLLDLMEMRANGWAPQSKWWVQQTVPAANDTTIEAEVNNLKAIRTKNRRNKKNPKNSRRSGDREKTLRAILNQVVPSNMDRMVSEFGQIFQKKKNMPEALVGNIITHILGTVDPKFIRVQAELISKACMGCPHLKAQLADQLLGCIQENSSSVSLIRFCAELFILGILSLGEILSTLQKLSISGLGGVECVCVFFHRVQYKLFRLRRKMQVQEKVKIETIMQSLAKSARLHCPFRLRCMVLDIDDLHHNHWEVIRPLLWNPTSLCIRTQTFSFENVINVFNANEEDGLEFMQENFGTDRDRIGKFVEDVCIWAIGNANIMSLVSCGKFIKSIIDVQLLTSKRFQPILASLVQSVALMKRKPDAWAHLGVIIHELYNP